MNILKKPKQPVQPENLRGRFEKFNLTENPFPAQPIVNKDSSDERINGKIYETEIRRQEYGQIEQYFLKPPQNSPNHLSLGYIIDTSYVGRGNGKTAFLVNLLDIINKEFCMDISEDINKCAATYLTPESGGRTKTFDQFADLLFESILSSGIIKISLALLRLDAILELYPNVSVEDAFTDEEDAYEKLNSRPWFDKNDIELGTLTRKIWENKYIHNLPPGFPLCQNPHSFSHNLYDQKNFQSYYNRIKQHREKLDFIFSDLVNLFLASGFTGFFILVDDFERIPEFQSANQKKDFARELRTCLFDGLYTNAKTGFYNFILVLHAGVQRLISDAWGDSGMDHRAPISSHSCNHVIPFRKLTIQDANLMLKKYISRYRIDPDASDPLFPFTDKAVEIIAKKTELNAARILKTAYGLIEKAVRLGEVSCIDEDFIQSQQDKNVFEEKPTYDITKVKSTDLMKKAAHRD